MCKNSVVCQQDHDHAPEIPPNTAAILPPAIQAIPLLPVAKKQRVIKNRKTPRSDALMLVMMIYWHPTKNVGVDPRFVSDYDSSIWWRCVCKSSKCLKSCKHVHECQASINHRFTKDGVVVRGCPWCSANGGFSCPCQSLAVRRPDLALQWHPTLNGDLLPSQVSVNSHKKVFWICLVEDRNQLNSRCAPGCTEEHFYEARIEDRSGGKGCPLCRGNHLFCPCRSLAARFPDLVENEWDLELNTLSPTDVSSSSNKMARWICPKCEHPYPARIHNRTSSNPTACPKCQDNKWEKKLLEILVSLESVLQHSKPSIECYCEILQKTRTLRPDAKGVILANGHTFFVEYDGPQHFEPQDFYGKGLSDLRLQICSDLAKNAYAEKHGMSVLRMAFSDVKTLPKLEKRVRDFIAYCASTTTPKTFLSNPDLYRKTAEIVA